mmetsp:Transcript_17710/g.33583  ORF Transcript_17710/g.33583 Transcript_17710/m.33583 type:complete len:520 (+) Transcript_17710:87-1646(+)|eukprot:scaffold8374_cov175-Amphora_coffeaeformis.AAC.97
MIASSTNMLASDVPTHCPTGNESGDDVSTDGLSVAFSVNSTDDPDMEQRRSKREALRAKLRGAEKRLLQFTSSNSSGGSGFLGQMAAVQADLKKVEEEKNKLESELSKLRDSTGDDAYLNEKMSSIQEGFDKQVEKIRSLQEEVITKDDEIERLHEELIEKLRRVVELEFDLETHEVHYTNYAKEQFKLGEDALAEIKGLKDMQDKGASMDDPEVQIMAPRKAQKLISKLLADLDDLEARYKEDKLESSSKVHRVELVNEQLRTRVQVLEDSLAATNASKTEGSGPSNSSEHVLTLRKRVNTLEGKLTLSRKEIKRLTTEIENAKDQGESEAKEYKVQCDRLKMENDALKARIAEFESAKEKRGLLRRKKGSNGQDHFEDVENRIIDAYEKIAKLEAEREIKDRQISTLKNEVTTLRMKDIANGKLEGTTATKSDTDLLRSPASRSTDFHASADSDDAFVSDLKAQLQEAQQLLVKKDQELVIERAKAASTAAGLLARITEISGSKAGGGAGGKMRLYM